MNKYFSISLILFIMSNKVIISFSDLVSTVVTKQEVLAIEDMKFGFSLALDSAGTF